MTHPDYEDGAYLFSPISDDRQPRLWPVYLCIAAPFLVAMGVHLAFW